MDSDRTDLSTFDDLLQHVADRKRRAAQSRREPKPIDVRKPRDVFVETCLQVAERFEANGFRWLKARDRLVRKRGAIEQVIWFSSSNKNIAGEYVELEVGGLVYDKQHTRWRQVHRSPFVADTNALAGGGIWRLDGGPMTSWNVVDDASRPAIILEIIDQILTRIVPYLELFSDPAAVVEMIRARSLQAIDERNAIEYLLRFGHKPDAEVVASRFLDETCSHQEVSERLAVVHAGGELNCLRFPDWLALAIHHFSLQVELDGADA